MTALTLKESKNQIAKKYGYRSWDETNFYQIDEINQTLTEPYADVQLANEAAELYCQSQKAQVWEEGKEALRIKILDAFYMESDLITSQFIQDAKPVNPYLIETKKRLEL